MVVPFVSISWMLCDGGALYQISTFELYEVEYQTRTRAARRESGVSDVRTSKMAGIERATESMTILAAVKGELQTYLHLIEGIFGKRERDAVIQVLDKS